MTPGSRSARERVDAPLAGLRVVEFAGIGPLPYAVMLLADLGAEVLTIRGETSTWPEVPIISRGRATLTLDLKNEDGLAAAREAMCLADVVAEAFRPGVMERLGLGPNEALKNNPRLIYARMTGWGQDGPLARIAGHDINYIALAGLLAAITDDQEPPDPPLNLLGDYAAGSMFLAIGVLAALIERAQSGQGQVVDVAILDGAISLLAPVLGMIRAGVLRGDSSHSLLGGRMPFYRTYRCGDGKDLAVGALEPSFRRILTDKLGLGPHELDGDPEAASTLMAGIFAAQPRDHWLALFNGTDACVTPVLTPEEAYHHPHVAARRAYWETEAGIEPAPVPRFSRTRNTTPSPRDPKELLSCWREN